MTAAAALVAARPAAAPSPAWPFLRQEYLRVLRSRQAMLGMGFLLYAVVGMPVILAKPHEEVLTAVRTWFGDAHFELKLFLFAWIDLAMNKISLFLGAILASGIVADERSKGTLDLFLSKPVTLRRYWRVKLLAAVAAFATMYAAAAAIGAVYFSLNVRGFAVGPFALMSLVHVFAACFAVVFAGTMAIVLRHKLTAMITSITALSLLVGFAFMGFYDPSLRGVAVLNPYYHGAALIDDIGDVRALDVLSAIAWLLAFNGLVFFIGSRRAAALENDLDR